ncbi:MAG: hypothetical protein EOM55_01380 [Clostridia bacterium]|nr:hypothetical protein [Clostridia bacterium]
MILLSNIVSKKVLNLFSGKIEGTIKSLCFNELCSNVASLKMFSEDDDEFLIDSKKVYSIGESAIVIKNASAMISTINQCNPNENSPINLEVYSMTGDYLGQVCDAELSNNLKLNFLITKTHRIRQDQIVNVGGNIIVNTEDKKIRISDFKPHIKISPNIPEEKVYILAPKIEKEKSGETETQTIVGGSQSKFKLNTLPCPQRIMGNSNFLLGRKMFKTVYGQNNEIIIKKEFLINENTINCAKQHGKLMELTMYSRKKA